MAIRCAADGRDQAEEELEANLRVSVLEGPYHAAIVNSKVES